MAKSSTQLEDHNVHCLLAVTLHEMLVMLYTNVIKMPKAVLLPINSSMLWNVPDLLPQPVPATPYSIPWPESGPFQQKSFPKHDSAITSPQCKQTY